MVGSINGRTQGADRYSETESIMGRDVETMGRIPSMKGQISPARSFYPIFSAIRPIDSLPGT